MKRYKFLIVTIACFLAGCGWVPPWEYYYAKSFIACYCGGELYADDSKDGVQIYWKFRQQEYSHESWGKDKEIYEQLCIKHNDTEYNEWEVDRRELDAGDFNYRMVYWKDFVAIDVLSDRDFDIAHPAGTSLGDVVAYWGISYWDWVKSGYSLRDENGLRQDRNIEEGYVNDIPEEGLCLMENLSLHFPIVPESAVGEHNLTITITADDGTVYNLGCTVSLDATEE